MAIAILFFFTAGTVIFIFSLKNKTKKDNFQKGLIWANKQTVRLLRHPEVKPERTVTRSQTDSLNLVKERSKLEIRKNFSTVRSADIWNIIPSDIKNIRQVIKF